MKKIRQKSEKTFGLPVVSWALYDFANTIFSILVVTRFLPPFLKEITGGSSAMGAAVAFSMVVAGLLVPILGAISDWTGKTKRYLIYATVASVTATAAMSFTRNIPALLALFFAANLTYQTAMVFYNSLLPTISRPSQRGFISGVGVSLGYAGSFAALIAANPYVKVFGIQNVFVFTALLFLLFSLPIFFFVEEREVEYPVTLSRRLMGQQLQNVFQTLRELPTYPPVLFFLLGNFFCLDAVNTTIVFYSEFLLNARSVSATKVDLALISVQLAALFFSLLIGRLTDRVGSKTMLLWVSAAWIGAIGLILISSTYTVVLIASIIGGFGLGGIWVAGRTMMLELVPPERVGAFLGLYGMTGKFSALGALWFGLLADWLSYESALFFQLIMLALGMYFFSKIKTRV
ncbi:MAG: MFS transporter [bacterium]|nr:MFS transporter [bacterium]